MQYSLFSDALPPSSPPPARSDVRTGDTAEILVLYKLLLAGYDAYLARRDAPYDIAVDLGDGLVRRVQVKSQGKAVKGRWHYSYMRGNPRTGGGSYNYADNDFDISACVALSLEKVLFSAGVQRSISLRTADFMRPNGDRESWERALQAYKRKPSLKH